ncbi:MAG: hypothetical protein HQL72_14180 [Magnetococcales bacterium]|nr:hypothetical protein [Magnetococcales bacterium]
MTHNPRVTSPLFLAGLTLLITLSLLFYSKTLWSEPGQPSQQDCQQVNRTASLIPPHITAFYGRSDLPHVENIQEDLDRTIALLMAQNPGQFQWVTLDFEDIVVECQLAWREETIQLFKTLQSRSNFLAPSLAAIQSHFPDMPPLEVGQWLGENISIDEIARYIQQGVTSFEARMKKKQQGNESETK